jgi:hypothetical protein
LAAVAALTVAVVRVGLTALPFSTLRRTLLGIGASPLLRRPPGAASADELAWAVRAAGRRVPRATCLVQALSLELLLARAGHDAELRIGVARDGDGLTAHAWVESGGECLLGGSAAARFAPLPATGRS